MGEKEGEEQWVSQRREGERAMRFVTEYMRRSSGFHGSVEDEECVWQRREEKKKWVSR